MGVDYTEGPMTNISIPTPYVGPRGYRIGGFVHEMTDFAVAEAPVAIRLPKIDSEGAIEFRLHDGRLWEPSLNRNLQQTLTGAGGHLIFDQRPGVQKDLCHLIEEKVPLLTYGGALTPSHKRAKHADAEDMSADFQASEAYAAMTKMAGQFAMIGDHLYRESPGPILMARQTRSLSAGHSRWALSKEIEHPWFRVTAWHAYGREEAFEITGEDVYGGHTFGEPEFLLENLPVPNLADCAIEGAAIVLLDASYREPAYLMNRAMASAIMDLRNILSSRAPGNTLHLDASGYGMFSRPYQPWKAKPAKELIEPVRCLMESSKSIRTRLGSIIKNTHDRISMYADTSDQNFDDEDLDLAISATRIPS